MTGYVWSVLVAGLVLGYVVGRTRPRHRLFDALLDIPDHVPRWLDLLNALVIAAAFALRPVYSIRTVVANRRWDARQAAARAARKPYEFAPQFNPDWMNRDRDQ